MQDKVLNHGQKIYKSILQLPYKIDMCYLVCEKHMLFKWHVLASYIFLIALIKKKKNMFFFTCLKDTCQSHM